MSFYEVNWNNFNVSMRSESYSPTFMTLATINLSRYWKKRKIFAQTYLASIEINVDYEKKRTKQQNVAKNNNFF